MSHLAYNSRTTTRSPSSALSHSFFGWEGSPTKTDYRTKVGTLLLTSLLEDLVPLAFHNLHGVSPLGFKQDLSLLFVFSRGLKQNGGGGHLA